MKKMFQAAMVLSLALVLLAPFMTGCAGDRYQQSTGEYVDDASITSKVKAALFKDPEVKGLAVKVKTFKGEVQLSGFVNSQHEKDRAGEIARSINGVQWVNNDIRVK
jgi:osmotically-inducible protein OsmY